MKRIVLPVALVLINYVIMAQHSFKVYYLAIGSGHYEHDSKKFTEKDFIPYDDLPEANYSVLVMSQVLQLYAGAKGITLQSSQKDMMTQKRVMAGIDSLAKMAVNDKAQNPLLLIYYCGHGISENLGWNQFMIPGNYTSVAGTKQISALGEKLIFLGDITDKLDKYKKRYVVITDCCRKEEADNSIPEAQLRYFFDKRNVETFKTVVAGLKFLNEYHQVNPVIFSIAPGSVAPTVDLPANDIVKAAPVEQDLQIGPVCRRLLLLLNKSKQLSLGQLVNGLTDSNLDEQSPVSVCFYKKEEDQSKDFPVFSK